MQVRAFPVPNSRSRSTVGRVTWSLPATSPAPLRFRTRACGSDAAPRTTSLSRTTTAAPSRPARSTDRSSRFCWLKSSSDLLAIQIEGSGRVILEDGTPLRVAFDSHNGYAFSSIERVLIDRNIISREEISTQRIREWMAAHPDEAVKVRAANRSYVFFRVTGLSNDGEPVGAQGVPLTAGRSIAVDRVHEYGTPFFIEANLPIESGKSVSPFSRLMIAQDTGSAIVGPARADLYWGAGDDAGRIAGRIRHPGRFVMLLPRELELVAAQSEIPLPVAKPKIAEVDFTKQAGKGSVESAGAAAIMDGRRLPLPTPKVAALDVTKQNGKRKTEIRQRRRDAGQQAEAVAGAGTQDRRARSRETGRQRQGKFHKRRRGRGGQDYPVAGTETGGFRDQRQATGWQGQSESTGAGWTVGGRQKPLPAPKPKISETRDQEKGRQRQTGSSAGANAGAIAIGHQKSLLAPTKFSEIEVRKQDGKGKQDSATADKIVGSRQKPLLARKSKMSQIEARKEDGKGKAHSATAGKLAADKHMPSPHPKSKTSRIEAKKQKGKGKAEASNAGEDARAVARSGRQAVPTRKSYRGDRG